MPVYQKLKDWQWKKAADSQWNPSKDPEREATEIFVDLLEYGQIPDPFIDSNEAKVQWVGAEDWDYKSVFEVGDEINSVKYLKFNGLDTFAEISLNGERLCSWDNMFEIRQVDIQGKIRRGTNDLVINFRSAELEQRRISREHYNGYIPKCFNGEGNRAYIRKAQYHAGWDWGPTLMSCGPYRPIEVITVDPLHVSNFHVYCDFTDGTWVTLEAETEGAGEVIVQILDPDAKIVVHEAINLLEGDKKLLRRFQIANAKLWYPNNYGAAALYTLKVSTSSQLLIEHAFGIREVQLCQSKFPEGETPGSSFHFSVNGTSVYCSGVNWIPAHSFNTVLSDTDYREWLELAADAGFNMVRVWGGGLYEPDVFYHECDRLGLLVWQDFMFACGQYPGDDAFVALVKREVDSQLARLRNFCSIVLFSGNNEDYQVAEQESLDLTSNTTELTETSFPARRIYEDILPRAVKIMCHDLVPYHPGSPYSNRNTPTTDQTIGDLHQWNVWHGTQESYQNWDKLGGRFVSEFGMLSFARCVAKYITDGDQLFPQGSLVAFHNKASGSEARVSRYLFENFKITEVNMESWCYLTQLMQSDCLMLAVNAWRRHWIRCGEGRLQSGYIVWQLNDCWPAHSWAIVDHERTPKLAYYALKRQNSALISVSCQRVRYDVDGLHKWKESLNDETHQYADYVTGLELHLVNLTLNCLEGLVLQVRLLDVSSGEDMDEFVFKNLAVPDNESVAIPNIVRFASKSAIVHLSLFDAHGNLVYRAVDWPQPLKFLKFGDPKIKVNVDWENSEIVVETELPVKGLEIYSDTHRLSLSDNNLDLVPGEPQIVKVKNLSKGMDVKHRYYGMRSYL